MEFKTILHATDFSDASKQALDQARNLAKFHQAKLHLLHVQLIPEGGYSALDISALSSQIENLAEYSEKQLKELLPDRDDSVTLATVRHSRAAVAIADYAERNDIDLIVVGSHGYSGIDRFLLGSEATKLVRRATVPVLVVRSGIDVHLDEGAPFKQLLAPVDLSDPSLVTVREADQLADLYGATLTVVHVLTVIAPSHYSYVPADVQLKQARKALNSFIYDAKLGIDPESLVLPGPSTLSIIDTAEQQGTDLIIMSRSGLSGWQRFLLGSTTERVLNNANCAVLVLPAGEKTAAEAE